MKNTIQLHEFVHCDALKNAFSYDGRIALFDYLEQLEQDCGIEFDFDPVALRCEFTEYANIAEFWNDYDRYEFQCISDIENATSVIYIGNPDSEDFIIQQF
jgi:hypothetical protein